MDEVIYQISERISLVSKKFFSLTESQRQLKLEPEKWSKKEILGHLIDSAQTNIRRLIIAQYQANENTVYNQNIWVNAADYQNYDSEDLGNLWILLNKHFCIILKNMPTDHYEALIDWGKDEPDLVSVNYMVHDYVVHMDAHIKQMNFN